MYYLIFISGLFLTLGKNKKKSALIFSLILFFLSIFRYGVGADYFVYEFLFERLSTNLFTEIIQGNDPQEILFRLFGSFIKSFGITYQVYLGVIASINLFFVYKVSVKHSKNPTLSILLYYSFYFFIWTFSGLRQGLVLTIGMYFLLEFLNKKQDMYFTLIVIFLSLIHASALILIVLYFLSKIYFNKSKLIVISVFSILFSLLPLSFIFQIFSFVPLISRLIPYLDIRTSLFEVFDFQSFVRLVFLVFALFHYDQFSLKGNDQKKMINIYILSFVIYFFFKFSELTAARLSIYGKFLDVILLTNFFYLYKDKKDKIIYGFTLIILSLLVFVKELDTLEDQSGLRLSNEILTPYTNIFNPEEYYFEKRDIWLPR